MKKLLTILGVCLLGLTSCKKEEIETFTETSPDRDVRIQLGTFGSNQLSYCQFKAEVNDNFYYKGWSGHTQTMDLFTNEIPLQVGDTMRITTVLPKVAPFPQLPVPSGYTLKCISNGAIIFSDDAWNGSQYNNDTIRYTVVVI